MLRFTPSVKDRVLTTYPPGIVPTLRCCACFACRDDSAVGRYQTVKIVVPPGIEPGSNAPEAFVVSILLRDLVRENPNRAAKISANSALRCTALADLVGMAGSTCGCGTWSGEIRKDARLSAAFHAASVRKCPRNNVPPTHGSMPAEWDVAYAN